MCDAVSSPVTPRTAGFKPFGTRASPTGARTTWAPCWNIASFTRNARCAAAAVPVAVTYRLLGPRPVTRIPAPRSHDSTEAIVEAVGANRARYWAGVRKWR